jgi:O-antigen/teichoic acid export membrane protein
MPRVARGRCAKRPASAIPASQWNGLLVAGRTPLGRLRDGWRRLSRSTLQDRFLRRLALLSGGTMLGQAIVLLTSPLLTRLYTPEQFGLLAVFTSLSGMLGSSMALRYEFAVPVCSDDDEAAAVVRIAMLATALLSALVALAAWGLGPWLAALTATPGLVVALWLLPLSLLFWGLGLPLSLWAIRRSAYRVVAANKVIRFAAQAAVQVGLGLTAIGGLGLAAGVALGYLASAVHFLIAMPPAAASARQAAGPGRLWRLAARHWRYPVFSTPSGLLQSSTQFLPATLVAVVYGPAAAGWFVLAQRTLEMPVILLSNSASAVFLGEVRGLTPVEVRRLVLRTGGRFLGLGLVGMAPLLLFGPELFALIFGEPWRVAGSVLQCLIPVQLARFVVIPISQTLNLFARQELHLVAAALGLTMLSLAFGLGWWLQLPLLTTLLLLSLGLTLAYLVYLQLTWRVIRAAAAGGSAPPPHRPPAG